MALRRCCGSALLLRSQLLQLQPHTTALSVAQFSSNGSSKDAAGTTQEQPQQQQQEQASPQQPAPPPRERRHPLHHTWRDQPQQQPETPEAAAAAETTTTTTAAATRPTVEEEWTEVIDEKTGQPYYWNPKTGETTDLGEPRPKTRFRDADWEQAAGGGSGPFQEGWREPPGRDHTYFYSVLGVGVGVVVGWLTQYMH